MYVIHQYIGSCISVYRSVYVYFYVMVSHSGVKVFTYGLPPHFLCMLLGLLRDCHSGVKVFTYDYLVQHLKCTLQFQFILQYISKLRIDISVLLAFT